MLKRLFLMCALTLGVFIVALPPVVRASATSGTIDPQYSYAWSDQLGWINFLPSQGHVSVTDAGLAGYAWSQSDGWINFAPATSGVKNDAEGHLSGSAWGENLGWIDFSNIVIDNDGWFHGTATGELAGTITFDCQHCAVRTDWRPASARGGSTPEIPTPEPERGGGTAPPEAFLQPKAPVGGFRVLVNNSASPLTVQSRKVALSFRVGPDVDRMAISNEVTFVDVPLVDFEPRVSWDICASSGPSTDACPSGTYHVYVKFYTKYGLSTDPYEATIFFREPVAPEAAPPPAPIVTDESPEIPSAPPTAIRAVQIFTRNLRPGQWHPDVKRLQQFLNVTGFTVAETGDGSPGHETNFYGRLTRAAVQRLQGVYAAQILEPFGISSPTGWFYRHTRTFVNDWMTRDAAR